MTESMTDTRLAEIRGKALAAAADLRRLLPEQVDYAALVCAEGFAHGQHYVWTDPEPYAMDAAAKAIGDMLSEIDRLTAENARLDEELGRCTSGNGTYISLESHNRILAKLTAELLQKTQQLTETNKALESDNYNAEMNLSRLTERLAAAVEDINRCMTLLEKIHGHWPCELCSKDGKCVTCHPVWRGEGSE